MEMPEVEVIKKILLKEKVYATFVKATEFGLRYCAQIIYPGQKDLIPVCFLIPLEDLRGRDAFLSVIPAGDLLRWMADY